MKAGRELDALIAEKVMGHLKPYWSDSDFEVPGTEFIGGIYRRALVCREPESQWVTEVPSYSTDVGDAWGVVAKVGAFTLTHGDEYGYIFTIHPGEDDEVSVEAETPELAICLAALKAAT